VSYILAFMAVFMIGITYVLGLSINTFSRKIDTLQKKLNNTQQSVSAIASQNQNKQSQESIPSKMDGVLKLSFNGRTETFQASFFPRK
jgi:biopolymer transport protein ExbB/TolQ